MGELGRRRELDSLNGAAQEKNDFEPKRRALSDVADEVRNFVHTMEDDVADLTEGAQAKMRVLADHLVVENLDDFTKAIETEESTGDNMTEEDFTKLIEGMIEEEIIAADDNRRGLKVSKSIVFKVSRLGLTYLSRGRWIGAYYECGDLCRRRELDTTVVSKAAKLMVNILGRRFVIYFEELGRRRELDSLNGAAQEKNDFEPKRRALSDVADEVRNFVHTMEDDVADLTEGAQAKMRVLAD